MDWDDVTKKPTAGAALGANLDQMSVSELEDRIAALRSEIARVEQELARKQRQKSAADALFKS